MSTLKRMHIGWLTVACLAGTAGCQSSGLSYTPTEAQRRQMLTLTLTHEIEILPFTQIASFDDDDLPDGVLVVLQPRDTFGDPVKAAGFFYFELWTYNQASGERKGKRLAFWEQTLDSAPRIERAWTRAEMYEFQLAWTEGAAELRPGHKYVVTATYRAPWDETMQDEYVLDFVLPPGLIEKTASR